MKRLLLFAAGIVMSMASFAQEDDVTNYIQNAGFDEDLTWQTDGAKKDLIDQSTVLSDRSIAGIAADSSVYALVNPSTPKTRADGRTFEATNGFIGRVQGWTIETNQTFPKCEWVYFGTIPYDLVPQAIPIADDGGTYLEVPSKPDAYNSDDNIGFAYLRAGWGGRAVYKQTVKLPCAKYRLEYWAININPSGTNGKNLSKVTCRKDVFVDETGFSDQEWTLHTIEFTPTAEFSMEFGFESEGGSGSNPFLCIDGIKLYKIGDADPMELLKTDVNDLIAECNELSGTFAGALFNGLAAQISDYEMELGDLLLLESQEELEAGLKDANARIAEFKKAVEQMAVVNAMLAKMDNLLQTTDFAGKADFEAAYNRINGYKMNDAEEGVNVLAQILGAADEATDAIKAYYISQVATATPENPADMTIFIQNPWFINAEAEPSLVDGMWEFPLRYNEEDGSDRYTEGSASSADLNSTGWYIAGASGGDQRLNWQRERSCWNAWNSNFYTTIAVAQDIDGLPNGYYTVAADMITQSGYANGTQRVFAQSLVGKNLSTNALQSDGYDYNEWETVSMSPEDKVMVVNGKLTIGAQGTGDGNASAGWFLATNFKLYFLGAITEEEAQKAIQNAFDKKVAEANDMAASMKFNADKKALNDSIAKAKGLEAVEAIGLINTAMAEAQKSIDKYNDYLPSEEKIAEESIDISTKTLIWVNMLLNGQDVEGKEPFEAGIDIAKYAYDYVMNWIAADTATYTKFDAAVDLLKNYVNTYIPVYKETIALIASAPENIKASIEAKLDAQKTALCSEMKDKATVDAFVEELNQVALLIEKQKIVDQADATDYTAFILNPNAEALAGWTFVMGNGDGNGEKSGQWFDGSSTRYFDTYNGGGLKGFSATQLITSLPNGTYKVGVYTRTPAEGAYVLTAVGNDTTFVEIPLDYYMAYNEETGEEEQAIASDTHGPIWEEANAAYESGDYTELQEAIATANGSLGRGWKHQEIDNIVVTNHELLIGTMAGTEESKTEKVFAGNWYSVGGWTLTLIAKGDNTGWEGPLADSIVTVEAMKAVDGIYTLTGAKTTSLKRGLNIIVRNGKAQKVMVK